MPGAQPAWERVATLKLTTIVLALATIVLAAVAAIVQVQAYELATRVRSDAERAAEELVASIAPLLAQAGPVAPATQLARSLGAGEFHTLRAEDLDGFPSEGTLVLGQGSSAEERVGYTSFDGESNSFRGLERGAQCSLAGSHASGVPVSWAPAADGTGFVWRSASAAGPIWRALTFEPRALVSEASRGRDLNADGDRSDQLELGRIRLRSWPADGPADAATDQVLCAPMVLSELCRPGGDLDGDGQGDPIFLWDSQRNVLTLRFFLLAGDGVRSDSVRLFERHIDLLEAGNP